MSGMGVLFLVCRWCTCRCVCNLLGLVGLDDVDGVFTLGADVGLCTLVTDVQVCVCVGGLTCVVEAKMSASC